MMEEHPLMVLRLSILAGKDKRSASRLFIFSWITIFFQTSVATEKFFVANVVLRRRRCRRRRFLMKTETEANKKMNVKQTCGNFESWIKTRRNESANLPNNVCDIFYRVFKSL